MEVLDPEHSGINLFDENWKIYSRNSGMTGHRIGDHAIVEDSMITDGCNVQGTVKHSILFSGVTVEEGAIVEEAGVARGLMGDSLPPVYAYAAETAIQLTLTELNESLREIYLEAYTMPSRVGT